MDTRGVRAAANAVAKDFAEHPQPHVTAWQAYWLLFAVDCGLKDLSDPKRGFELAKDGAAAGSAMALELVGSAWVDGRGTGFRDRGAALRYFQQAADQGRASSLGQLTWFHFFGVRVPRDRGLAETLARRAAWLGEPRALGEVGAWYEDPKSDARDHAKALALYFEAAQYGHEGARALLTKLATDGDKEALKYAKMDVVKSRLEGMDYPTTVLRAAVKWLEENASPDDAPVQIALADVMKEKLLPVYDAAAARAKLERAAAAGNDDARFVQGIMLARGIGQRADVKGAIALWRELAARDNARAIAHLCRLYWWGNEEAAGMPKDAGKAFAYAKRAADLGSWIGQLTVADCYAHGIGVEENYYLAGKYYGITYKRGYVRGRDMQERILAKIKD